MRRAFFLCFVICTQSVYAQNTGTNFKTILLEAVNSPSGRSTSEVTGNVADLIREKTGQPNARIVATVTTVRELPQSGCKRLKVSFDTPGTRFQTKEGSQRKLEMGFEMNLCPNGQPPGDDPKSTAGSAMVLSTPQMGKIQTDTIK